jgi:hypothetical protein
MAIMSTPAVDLNMLANDIAEVLDDEFYAIDVDSGDVFQALIKSDFMARLREEARSHH